MLSLTVSITVEYNNSKKNRDVVGKNETNEFKVQHKNSY
jgi:hypothetical protein